MALKQVIFEEGQGVAGNVVFAPQGTPPELIERAAALVAAGQKLNLSEKEVAATPAYREVELRIRWSPFVRLTEATAKVIVAATVRGR